MLNILTRLHSSRHNAYIENNPSLSIVTFCLHVGLNPVNPQIKKANFNKKQKSFAASLNYYNFNQKNKMKRILIAVMVLTVFFTVGCDQNRPPQNNVTVQSNNTPPGFDVNKLAQLVKTSTDPQTLEKGINNPANHINNLDLDKDGNVDYLKVVEGDQNRLDVVDNVNNTDSVTVARIKVDPSANNTADLSVRGNPDYVGYNNYYHSSFSFTDFLLLSYLMRPHSYYMPMYHYGYYPSYYTRVRTVSTFRPTTSPAMSSRSFRVSISNPSQSQRSFSTRGNAPVRSGGFGKSSPSRSPSASPSRSFGRSRGGFGRRR